MITEVHSDYCKYCPSHNHPPDSESEMIAAMPEGEKQKYVFPCAWRNNKLCKGVCEDLNYQEENHANILMERSKNVI